jgi:GrpB-like predicted nucleotidyltransferase (UPF0157 family)
VRTIHIETYHSDWEARFQREAVLLREILKKEILWLEHIGSTAIPGLSAKPIIDILVVVKKIRAIDAYNFEMTRANYWSKGAFGIEGRRFFIKGEQKRLDETHSVHVHIFELGHPAISKHLNFKYYLLSSPETRQIYGKLKEKLAADTPHDMNAYERGKNPLIEEILSEKVPWHLTHLSLQTERLILRPFRGDDEDVMHTFLQDPTVLDSSEYFPHPYTREAGVTWLRDHREECIEGHQSVFAITLTSTGDLIGAMGLTLNVKNRRGDLGYWVGKPHRRQGYCKEAARRIIRFGFLRLGCHKISARCFSYNKISIKLLQQLGLQSEGLLREEVLQAGEFKNVNLYGLLPSDVERL